MGAKEIKFGEDARNNIIDGLNIVNPFKLHS